MGLFFPMRTYFIKTGKFISKLIYPKLVWEIPTMKKELYITFDDGPTPGITEQTLDLLDDYQAKATFFLIGDKASRYPELVEEIKSRGHETGNHTHHHLKGWGTADEVYFKDIERANSLLETKLFRPPYGKISRSQIAELSETYHIIMWTVLSADFDNSITPEKCAQNVIENADKGSIIIFHDSEKAKERMLYALPETLNHFSQRGYQFNTLRM